MATCPASDDENNTREEWLDRHLAAAPPLSQRQQDVIATAFRGAIKKRPRDERRGPA